MPDQQRRRRRRRAVGPEDALPGAEPALDLRDDSEPPADDAAERYRRERPPHHDRGV